MTGFCGELRVDSKQERDGAMNVKIQPHNFPVNRTLNDLLHVENIQVLNRKLVRVCIVEVHHIKELLMSRERLEMLSLTRKGNNSRC